MASLAARSSSGAPLNRALRREVISMYKGQLGSSSSDQKEGGMSMYTCSSLYKHLPPNT
jgi:hypothetical protein